MALYQYALASYGTPAHGTGTITCSAGATAVTGSGTSFTTQLAVGDVISTGGIFYAIAAIADTTHMTLAHAAEAAISGAAFDYATLANLESMTPSVYAPKSSYRPYTDSVQLANGKVRGLGRPVATWKWGFITQAQRDKLRTYCPSVKSISILVRTRTNESSDAYQTFSGTLIWPDDEDKQTGRRVNFSLEFKNLVQL